MDDAAVVQELLWKSSVLPYQLWPCRTCMHHERWREKRDLPPSRWGCECGTGGGDWELWVFLAGRGTGKTKTGSAFAIRMALEQPGAFGCVIAPTHSDLRRIVVDGESGLVRTLERLERVCKANKFRSPVQRTAEGNIWNQAASEIRFANGSVIRTLSSEKPDRIRGENLQWVWADELAAWTRLEAAWEQLELANRLGTPRFLVTTTPRPLPLLKAFLKQEGAVVTTASTYDNPHLSQRMVARMRRLYEGTKLGRQELHGEILDEVAGALWTWEMVEDARALGADLANARRERTVTAVDPSGGGDAIGVVTAARYAGGRAGVLADDTLNGTPLQWGNRVAEAAHTWGADRVIGERNFGGDMIEAVLRAADPTLAYRDVTASRGKRQRAEPVAALFERGLVGLLGSFPELEHELTTWVPDTGMASPNRLDALVWAMTELMLERQGGTPLADLLVSPGGPTRASPWRT